MFSLPLQMGGMPGGPEMLVMLVIWLPFLLLPILFVYYLRSIAHSLDRLVDLREQDASASEEGNEQAS